MHQSNKMVIGETCLGATIVCTKEKKSSGTRQQTVTLSPLSSQIRYGIPLP
jgi:hypothetical protein